MPEKYKGKYRNESNRLQYWDYSAAGNYFITICIQNRECILGEVNNGKMWLSEYGKIVRNEFEQIPHYHPRVRLDAWVVMPNHVHCIITLVNEKIEIINGNKLVAESIHESFMQPVTKYMLGKNPTEDEIKQYRQLRRKMLIPKILGKFQMLTSKQINEQRGTPGIRNWQTDYYERIIWNPMEFIRIENYINNNPRKWSEDKLNNKF